jgi:Co/Zn/Cd efflux system component
LADERLRSSGLRSVLTDALTSVLAIVALLAGSVYGWIWLDPAMGIIGFIVIGRWSWGLIRDTGGVLLDYLPPGEDLPNAIRQAVELEGSRITDLHVWQLGPGHHGAIVSLVASEPKAPSHYREKLAQIATLSHVTIEVEEEV